MTPVSIELGIGDVRQAASLQPARSNGSQFFDSALPTDGGKLAACRTSELKRRLKPVSPNRLPSYFVADQLTADLIVNRSTTAFPPALFVNPINDDDRHRRV